MRFSTTHSFRDSSWGSNGASFTFLHSICGRVGGGGASFALPPLPFLPSCLPFLLCFILLIPFAASCSSAASPFESPLSFSSFSGAISGVAIPRARTVNFDTMGVSVHNALFSIFNGSLCTD